MDQKESPIKPRILLAPLDWGLGHATRCIPVIKQLLKKNCTVFLAGDGKVKSLLIREFPQLPFLHLPGYKIQYTKEKLLMPFHIMGQIPKILSAIKWENEWLEKIVEEHQIDAVISDNRYGLYHDRIPSVFITHQLFIKSGFGKLADEILQIENYRYINRFFECWVPDAEGENNLSGELSHPEKMPETHVRYLAPLSRFEKKEESTQEKNVLIILSGPEPQRTILEEQLVQQLKDHPQQVVLIRGLPENDKTLDIGSHVTVHNHLPAAELEKMICEASFIVSRCGYSTIMDLAALQKKSILIPTPGQTEQEYLALHLMKQNFALCITQDKFRLKNALELAASFNYHLALPGDKEQLNKTIDSFLAIVSSNKSMP